MCNGEMRTTLDVSADAQDIYHELSFMKFLKLMDCGWAAAGAWRREES